MNGSSPGNNVNGRGTEGKLWLKMGEVLKPESHKINGFIDWVDMVTRLLPKEKFRKPFGLAPKCKTWEPKPL